MRFSSAASLVVSAILLSATDANGQDDLSPAVQSLHGHSAVDVSVVWYNVAPPGRFDDLTEVAEAQLRSHGIKILEGMEVYETVGKPTLQIQVIGKGKDQEDGTQAWTMTVIVGFLQEVETQYGVSDQSAVTWQGGGEFAPFVCAPEICEQIVRALIEFQLDNFVKDLRTANGS